jgi:hypothetical protein
MTASMKMNRRAMLTAAAGLTTAGAASADAMAQPAPAAATINHVSMGARNLYETAHNLRAETGLGFYDGGFNGALGSKIFPLGAGAYLIVEGVVEPLALEDASNAAARQMHQSVADGDVFRGFCVRALTMTDLQAVAARHGWPAPVLNRNVGRIRNDGSRQLAAGVPPVAEAWPRGLPNFNFFPEPETHPSGQPVIAAAGLVQPLGIAWLEVGGSKADMDAWVGPGAQALPLRFNGRAPGVYALAVKTAAKEIVITGRPAPAS